VDLLDPAWSIVPMKNRAAAPSTMVGLEDSWAISFRLAYTPPSAETIRQLPHADIIQRRPVLSRAVTSAEGVD
jgi:hypothetical protein